LTEKVSEISKKSAQGSMDSKQVEAALEAIVTRLSTLKRKVSSQKKIANFVIEWIDFLIFNIFYSLHTFWFS
jgi:hypothetical protein